MKKKSADKSRAIYVRKAKKQSKSATRDQKYRSNE